MIKSCSTLQDKNCFNKNIFKKSLKCILPLLIFKIFSHFVLFHHLFFHLHHSLSSSFKKTSQAIISPSTMNMFLVLKEAPLGITAPPCSRVPCACTCKALFLFPLKLLSTSNLQDAKCPDYSCWGFNTFIASLCAQIRTNQKYECNILAVALDFVIINFRNVLQIFIV